MRLDGKCAFITGAGSGIGAACARRFAAEGAALALVDVNAAAAAAVADEIRTTGTEVFAAHADVTDRDSLTSCLQAAGAALGPLDVLVNCAGITMRNVPEGTDWLDGWQMVMDVNVKGTMLASTLFCEQAREHGRGGAIVNLSSIYGQVARPPLLNTNADPYTHSKGAVLQITRDLAIGNVAYGIRVNCLCPGFIRTPLTADLRERAGLEEALVALHPMGRLGEAEEVANAALFLASDEASFITGSVLPVDGGYLAV